MTPWLVQFPQAREAPDAIRRALRALDPNVEVIHLFRDRWVVGFYRPNWKNYQHGARMVRNWSRLSERAKNTASAAIRYRLGLLRMAGFVPMQGGLYRMTELDDRVVKDFADSQWYMLHAHDPLDQMDAMDAENERKRRALLQDELRAKNVLDYSRTSNFGRATPSVQSSITPPLPSGRTRHVIPA